MEHKNFKKCHSRNLDQTDLILDFLSTLDKNKNAGYSWQEEINQINKDWVRMMDGDPGSQDSLDGHHDPPPTRQYQKTISTSNNQQLLSPSKKVTWSSKLTNVKTISPKHHPPPSVPDSRNRLLLKHSNQENVNATDATGHVDSDNSDNLTYKSHPKHYHHHGHPHPHHGHHHPHGRGRSPHKMRLISFVPNGL